MRNILKGAIPCAIAFVITLALFWILYFINKEKKIVLKRSYRKVHVIFMPEKKIKEKRRKAEREKKEREKKKKPRLHLLRSRMRRFLTGIKLAPRVSSFMEASEIFIPQQIKPEDIMKDLPSSVFEEKTVDIPPKILFYKKPNYPDKARLRDIEGFVEVEFLVTSLGMVRDIKILRSSPEGIFEESVIQAIRSWRFQPARHAGKPVNCWCYQLIRFVLVEK
jgi:protein TonB